jgi:hypothetical protein
MRGIIRALVLSGVAGLLVAGAAVSASATEMKFGEIGVNVDTTASFGVGVRTHGQDCSHVSTAPAPLKKEVGCPNQFGNGDNINTDDGEINFGKWDPYSASVKAVSDIEAKYQNYGAFVRLKAFYDYIGNQRAGQYDTRFGRRPLDDSERSGARNAAGRDFSLLDAFLYGNFNVGDLPLNVRAGKQVINWGESLAIGGGINQFMTFDVGAIRTPGAEIKEALLPQEMVSFTLGLPADFGISAWYGLKWRKTVIDPVGTFFSGADVLGPGGTYLNLVVDGPQATQAGRNGLQLAIAEGNLPRNLGQYGLKLSYNADWLNDGTELGLYYVNYHSHLPFVQYSNGDPSALFGPSLVYGPQSYREAFPEDVKLIGASFSTVLDWLAGGTAFSGEALYQPQLPFALSAGESLISRWNENLLGAPFGTPGGATIAYNNAPGAYNNDFIRSNAISGQLSLIATLPTSHPVTSALGADLVILVGNWGFQYLPDITQTELTALAAPRSELQAPSNAGRPGIEPVRHPDSFSHGYRLISTVQYNNAFSTPWTLSPNIQFGEDFHTSAGPIGPGFLDSRKTLSLGVSAAYQNTWNLNLQWTATRGNSFQNLMDDRDFATFAVSYAF